MAKVSFLWRLVGVAAASASLLGACGGEGSSSNGNCSGFCRDFCAQLDKCNIDTGSSSCTKDCASGLGSANCSSARPASQLTCSELGGLFQCASYCATLCSTAPNCGSFDPALCAEGCASAPPIVCNPASVAARNCEQLKPELRRDEDLGRSLTQPGDRGSINIGGTGPSGAGSLCRTNSDCDGLRCDPATNVCGPCQTDDDCKADFGARTCGPDGTCMMVECVSDDDCFGRKCDVMQHKCVTCVTDADCAGMPFPHCSAAKHSCVQCSTDTDCMGTPQRSHCGRTPPFDAICIECLTDADCTDASLPRCMSPIGICTP